MTILAQFQGHEIEILDAFEGSSGRKLASVRYLDGHQVSHYSHGGWCFDSHDRIPVALLKGVHSIDDSDSFWVHAINDAAECHCKPGSDLLCNACQEVNRYREYGLHPEYAEIEA